MTTLTKMMALWRTPLLSRVSGAAHTPGFATRALVMSVASSSSPLIGNSRLPDPRGTFAASASLARSFSKSTGESSGGKDHLEKLVEKIERSREQGDAKEAVKHSLKLYEALTAKTPHDPNVLSVAFEIARLYDEELDEPATAGEYYLEALKVLPDITTPDENWLVSMNITTLGALAMCFERTEDLETAEMYYEKAIMAYNKFAERKMPTEQCERDSQLFAELNATVAMIAYHYGGNLAIQGHFRDAKDATKDALKLSEDSSMSLEELDRLQWCVHDLWLDMSLARDGITREDLIKVPTEPSDKGTVSTQGSSKKGPSGKCMKSRRPKPKSSSRP